MNIDELKNSWNSMNVPPASQTAEAELIARMRSGRVTTLRDRLSNLSVWLMVICAFGIIFMIPNIAATPTLAILGTCFFFLLGGMHFMAYRKVSRLNFSAMTVREAMRMVCEIESDRIRHRTIGIALGVPMVFYMCVTFRDVYGDYVFYGCIIGAILGLAIGFFFNMRAVETLREMKRQLDS